MNVQIIAPDEEFMNRNSHIWTCDRKYEHISIFHGCKMQFRCNNSDATTPTYKLMHNSLNINLVLPHFNVEYIIQII